ncbi:hypothetical protein GUITHDRAFT_166109, partial [Guillardia theta CCMP2712]
MAEQAAPMLSTKTNVSQEQMLSTLEASMATTKRGPRVDEKTMKIIPRSILGDPEEFQTMLRQQTAVKNPSTPGSENLASPTSAKTGRARFASGVSAITLPTSVSEHMDQSNMSPGLNTSMYYEQQENLDKESELRKSLKILEETKRREREERHKKLKALHIFQRFDQVKEQRILTRHEKRQAEWEAFRARMAKRLNKDPDDLVINRAEEFRMLLEEKDILGKVVPIEKRHGANLWQMSLRDAWTRYLTVGSIFSGLEMPFVDKPDLRPEMITYIRQPFKESNVVLNKTRKSRAEVPDEVSYVEEYKKQYSKSLGVLQPHEPELANIYIQGVGLEREYNQKLQETIRLKEEEEEKQRKEEERQARRASRMPTYLSRSSLNGTDAASLSARSYATTVQPTEASKTGIEPEKWEPDVEAPAMHFGSSRLLCHTVKEQVAEVRLGCMNVGNTAVYYKWTRKQLGVDSAKDGVQRVFQQDMSGSILPGANKEFVFTFKSDKPGIFAEEWRFEGRPLMEATEHVVVIKGVALEEDLGKTKRAELEMRIGASLKEHAVSDFVDELVDHIGTPRSRSRVLVEDPDVDRQVFIAQNKEAQIYYSNTTLKLFRSLADSTFELLNFPMELRKWDSSLESLKRLLYAIEDDYERERHIVQFNDIMKGLHSPRASRPHAESSLARGRLQLVNHQA